MQLQSTSRHNSLFTWRRRYMYIVHTNAEDAWVHISKYNNFKFRWCRIEKSYIQFEHTGYTTFKFGTNTPLVLHSQAGGFMGLLLGASILSLIEFFDYLILTCQTRRQQRKTSVVGDSHAWTCDSAMSMRACSVQGTNIAINENVAPIHSMSRLHSWPTQLMFVYRYINGQHVCGEVLYVNLRV